MASSRAQGSTQSAITCLLNVPIEVFEKWYFMTFLGSVVHGLLLHQNMEFGES